jgi:regulator of replication initiation timing
MDFSDILKALTAVVFLLGGGGAVLLAGRRGLSKTRDVETDENSKRDFLRTILADSVEARRARADLESQLRDKVEENGQLDGEVKYLRQRVTDLEAEVTQLTVDRTALTQRVAMLEQQLNRLLRKYGTDTDFGGAA